MEKRVDTEIQWKQSDMIEVVLNEPVTESKRDINTYWCRFWKELSSLISCTSKASIVHFKELFALMESIPISQTMIFRDAIASQLLCDWGLLQIVSTEKVETLAPLIKSKSSLSKRKVSGLWNQNTISVRKKSVNRNNEGGFTTPLFYVTIIIISVSWWGVMPPLTPGCLRGPM